MAVTVETTRGDEVTLYYTILYKESDLSKFHKNYRCLSNRDIWTNRVQLLNAEKPIKS